MFSVWWDHWLAVYSESPSAFREMLGRSIMTSFLTHPGQWSGFVPPYTLEHFDDGIVIMIRVERVFVVAGVRWRSPTRASSWSYRRRRRVHRRWPCPETATRRSRSPSPVRRPATPSGPASTRWLTTRWSSTDKWPHLASGSTRPRDCWNWWRATRRTLRPNSRSRNSLFSFRWGRCTRCQPSSPTMQLSQRD